MQEPRRGGVAGVWFAGWEAQEGVTQKASALHYTRANAVFSKMRHIYGMETTELRQMVIWWWEYKSKQFPDELQGPVPNPLCGIAIREFRQWMERHAQEVSERGLEEACRAAAPQFDQTAWSLPGHWQQRPLMQPTSPA